MVDLPIYMLNLADYNVCNDPRLEHFGKIIQFSE